MIKNKYSGDRKNNILISVKYFEKMCSNNHLPEIKPLKLEVYNSIVDDFNKLSNFSRRAENELRKKYKKFVIILLVHIRHTSWDLEYYVYLYSFNVFSLPSSTLGSIISLLIQRSMKQNYRKSPVISSKYHNLYEELMRDKNRGNIIMQ